MNPGVVNIWVWHGVRRYGKPRAIVHFEYDTSMAADGWRPVITWSRKEFLSEVAWDPTGMVVEGKPVMLRTPALQHREDIATLKPVLPLPSYPHGFLVLHEENLTFGRVFGASSKFVYAVHPKTMAYLTRRWRRRGHLPISDLDRRQHPDPVDGDYTVGVCLGYPRRPVYYLHSIANSGVVGTSATCTQVAVCVFAALFTLLHDPSRPASISSATSTTPFIRRYCSATCAWNISCSPSESVPWSCVSTTRRSARGSRMPKEQMVI